MSGPHHAAVPASSTTCSPYPAQRAQPGTPAGRHQSRSAETTNAPFTSHELAVALQRPTGMAHKITYCLRKMGTLVVIGKRQRAWLYALAEESR